jgi:hypothetical protein
VPRPADPEGWTRRELTEALATFSALADNVGITPAGTYNICDLCEPWIASGAPADRIPIMTLIEMHAAQFSPATAEQVRVELIDAAVSIARALTRPIPMSR